VAYPGEVGRAVRAREAYLGDSMRLLGFFLLFCSVVAFGFLIWSLVSLDRLGITLTHPRILVELGLGVGFLVVGLLLVR
jgi:hypothetical protein